jgi:putative DNA primase/helicase
MSDLTPTIAPASHASEGAVGRPRPTISVHDPLHEKVAAATAALILANDPQFPRVLVRGNTLVRVAERGELEELDADSLRVEVSAAAQFEKTVKNEPCAVDPPVDVCRALRSADSAEYGDLSRVDRIVDVPVLSASGRLITEPGYHAADRVYYLPAPGLEGVGPFSVDLVDDVERARRLLLDELLGDFDFVDESSRANAMALLLLPFVRDFIGDTPTPLHGILAPQPGVGKTFLAQAALIPGCGLVPAQAAAEGEEWRKRITSSLLNGSPAVLLDNLREVESGALAGSLTSPMWQDRILGESRIVSLPNRAAWVVTGNNLRVSSENVQRMVWIDLDPGDHEVARKRGKGAFRHPDLHAWAVNNRGDLVAAALTLVKFWLDQIHPEVTGPQSDHAEAPRVYYQRLDDGRVVGDRTMGSFEHWASVIGGILAANGIEGFLANRDRLELEADDELHDAADFLASWHALNLNPVEASELRARCTSGELRDRLPASLVGSRDLPRDLGNWLRDHKGQRIGGYQLVREKRRRNVWSVRKLD